MYIKARLAGVILAAICVSAVAACGSTTEPNSSSTETSSQTSDSATSGDLKAPGQRGVLRWGAFSITGDVTLDPSQMLPAGDLAAASYMFDSLFTLDDDGNVQPSLATGYDLSTDKLVLTLREGVTFADGEVFDAAAVKANLEHQQAKAVPPSAANLMAIDTMTVDSPTQLTLTLSRPAPELPYELARFNGLMVAPNHLDDAATHPIGTGPYLYNADESQSGSVLIFDANDTYWGGPEQVGFDRIELHLYGNLTQAAQALHTGELDGANVTPPDAASFLSDPDFVVPQGVSVNFGLVFLDRDGATFPAIKDQDVRCAVSQALNRNALISVGEGGLGSPATQIWSSGPFHVDGVDDKIGTNLDAASKVLSAQGPLNFDIPTNALFKARTETLATALSEAGVNVTVKPVADPFPTYYYTPDWPMVYTPIEVVHPAELIAKLIMPQGQFNPDNVADPELTDLYNQAAQLTGADGEAAWRKALEYVYTSCDIAVATALMEPIVVSTKISGAGLTHLVPGGATIRNMRFK